MALFRISSVGKAVAAVVDRGIVSSALYHKNVSSVLHGTLHHCHDYVCFVLIQDERKRRQFLLRIWVPLFIPFLALLSLSLTYSATRVKCVMSSGV